MGPKNEGDGKLIFLSSKESAVLVMFSMRIGVL